MIPLISHEFPLSLIKEGYNELFNDYIYASSILLEKNLEYFNLVADSLRAGKDVIVSCGNQKALEAFNNFKYIREIKRLYKATQNNSKGNLFYIIPNAYMNKQATLESLEIFKKQFNTIPGIPIPVIQGKNFKELVDCFEEMKGINGYVGTSASSHMFSESDRDNRDQRSSRAELLNHLQFFNHLTSNLKLCFLGLTRSDELQYYKATYPQLFSYIRFTVSSIPITCSLKKIKFNQSSGVSLTSRINSKDFFDIDFETVDIPLLHYNLALFRKINTPENLLTKVVDILKSYNIPIDEKITTQSEFLKSKEESNLKSSDAMVQVGGENLKTVEKKSTKLRVF